MRSAEFAVVSLLVSSAIGQGADVQGFSKQGIDNIQAAMLNWSGQGGKGKGLVSLTARNGKIVHYEAYGQAKGKAVPKDSIWNIMSMTKPLSGAAMMTFFEEGKFKLDDPVSKHIPEVANMKVNGAPQSKQMTMAMLMSHSAGFPGLIAASGATLAKGVESVIKGKLAAQPGSKWAYGPGVEIQGYLMEKWAKKDFNDILQERILQPLGMTDTGFFIAGEDKRSRVVGKGAPAKKPTRIIPSYGLHSTAMDYFKFCQAMLNGGEYNGKRILKPESIKLMRTNVLEPGVSVSLGGGKGVGFGLNFAVLTNPPATESRPKDTFYWGGAFGTIFWIDPTNNITWIGMISGGGPGGGLSGDTSLRAQAAKAIYDDVKRSAKNRL